MPVHDWTRVEVPLEATYATAYSFVPKRWQRVLEDAPAD